MSAVHGRVLPVLAAAAVLMGGANLAAYAANGHPVLLGGDNHAARATTVDNDGPGPAVVLKTRKGVPPMAVSSHRMVRRLNADRVDGMSGKALITRSWTYRIGGDSDEGPVVVKTFPGLPSGHYLATYDMVAGLYAPGAMTCWFTTPRSPVKAVLGQAVQQDDHGPLVVAATGYVDGTRSVSLTCESSGSLGAPAFDTYSSEESSYDSQVTFIRLDSSSVRPAGAASRSR